MRTTQYVIGTAVGNFLYLRGDGMPKWRDLEYASTFRTHAEAQNVIDGCGYKHDAGISIMDRDDALQFFPDMAY